MKRTTIALAVCAASLAFLSACSQVGADGPQRGPGWGPSAMMGYGYGPGAMMGYGRGWGPMMGPGYRWLPSDVSLSQRETIAGIEHDLQAKQWPLMQQMSDQMRRGTSADEQSERREYEQMAALQKQMFENMLDSRKRIDEVLTPAQRDELARGR